MKQFLGVALIIAWIASVTLEPVIAMAGEGGADGRVESGWTYALEGNVTESQLSEMLDKVKSEPLYLRLSLGTLLSCELRKDDARVETIDYVWQPGGHALNRRVGRGLYFLEEVFRLQVKPLPEDASADTLTGIRDDAIRQFTAYRNGVLESAQEFRIGESTRSYMEKYQHLLQEGSDANEGFGWGMARGAERHMRQLMQDWFPIGKEFSQLEMISGRSAKELDVDMSELCHEGLLYLYTFGGGGGMFPATKYWFFVEDGVIVAVMRG